MWGFKSLNNIKCMIIMGRSSFNNVKDYKKQKVLHHMGDTLLAWNICKWNKCLDSNPCLHRTTMGTNRKVVTFVCIFFIFHLLPLHFLCPTIDARIAWAIIKATCEIFYSTCSKSSRGGTLIEAPPISLMVSLAIHSL